VNPERKWHHEDSSVQMLQYLLAKNEIRISDYGLSAVDETFILEIIRGTPENLRTGRQSEKFYLYDIVNNSRSGLDVDKLDYFLRDIRHTNVNMNSVSFDRFFQLGKVMKADPIVHSKYERSSMSLDSQTPEHFEQNRRDVSKKMFTICYPEKMVGEAVNLFAIRFQMHQKVYTHKSVKKVEYMVKFIALFPLFSILNCIFIVVSGCSGESRSFPAHSRDER
jgi:HD superfamily phosphohydrolase